MRFPGQCAAAAGTGDCAALQDYVRKGGVVALFPGDRANPSDYEALSCLPAPVEKLLDTTATPERQSLVLLDPMDPLFTGLENAARRQPQCDSRSAGWRSEN